MKPLAPAPREKMAKARDRFLINQELTAAMLAWPKPVLYPIESHPAYSRAKATKALTWTGPMLNEATRILREHPEASAPFTTTDLTANFGRTYYRQGDYEQAVAVFESAEDPERFQFAIALAYENQGDYENAFRYFNRVIQLGRPAQHVSQARMHLNRGEYTPFRNAP